MENENKKTLYTTAEMEIVAFENEDVITTSGCGSLDITEDDL